MSFGNRGNDSTLTTYSNPKIQAQLKCVPQESIFKGRLLLREKFIILIGFILFLLLKKDADISLSKTFP